MDLHTYGMAEKRMDRWMIVKMDEQIPPVFHKTSLPLGSLPKNTRHQPILSMRGCYYRVICMKCQILFSFYSEMSYILDVIDLKS